MKSEKMREYTRAEMFPSQTMLDELASQRYAEAELMLDSLIYWPGSTYNELCILHPLQKECVKRILEWLESRELIYQENDYYFLWDKWDEEDK